MADAPDEPIGIEEARKQVRLQDNVDLLDDSQDDVLRGLIVAAREHVEGETGLVLTRREVVEVRSTFGPWIDLRSWPVASIDNIKYLDGSYVSQTLSTDQWIANTAMRPVRIASRSNYWPRIARCSGAVSVTVTAGYATPADVPARARQAMLLLISHWFANRDGVIAGAAAAALELPLGIRALLDKLRLRSI